MTNTAHLRGGPERATVADIDHARNLAITALDDLGARRDRLEAIISDLRPGA